MASILDNAAVRSAALPITVEQYHRLGEAGIIPQHTELLRGVIVEKMSSRPNIVGSCSGWWTGFASNRCPVSTCGKSSH